MCGYPQSRLDSFRGSGINGVYAKSSTVRAREHRRAETGRLQADVKPELREYRGADPVAYVVSLNLRRRHLDESQRAMVAARLATLRHGQRQAGQLAHVPT